MNRKFAAIVIFGVLAVSTIARQGPNTPSPSSQPQGQISPPSSDCHPSYGGCLDRNASDYDCEGGRGNGPLYTGRVRVIGRDVFELDRDGDGWGCE
jgi:hypothetical protein